MQICFLWLVCLASAAPKESCPSSDETCSLSDDTAAVIDMALSDATSLLQGATRRSNLQQGPQEQAGTGGDAEDNSLWSVDKSNGHVLKTMQAATDSLTEGSSVMKTPEDVNAPILVDVQQTSALQEPKRPIAASTRSTSQQNAEHAISAIQSESETSASCGYVVGDGIGGSESFAGYTTGYSQCAQLVRNRCPDANGATSNGHACYCEYGMTGTNSDVSWLTCSLLTNDDRSFRCKGPPGGNSPQFRIGDSIGEGGESSIGVASTPEECARLVLERCPTAGAATLPSSGNGNCFCEFDEDNDFFIDNSRHSWQTCPLEHRARFVRSSGNAQGHRRRRSRSWINSVADPINDVSRGRSDGGNDFSRGRSEGQVRGISQWSP